MPSTSVWTPLIDASTSKRTAKSLLADAHAVRGRQELVRDRRRRQRHLELAARARGRGSCPSASCGSRTRPRRDARARAGRGRRPSARRSPRRASPRRRARASMPLFSASSTPSLNASICTASERLIAIFIVTAEPFSARCGTPSGPIASRIGFTRSNASSSPPTISDALPCSTVIDVPRHRRVEHLRAGRGDLLGERARVRRARGRHVDVDLPGREPGEDAVVAFGDGRTAAVFVTIVKTISLRSATSRGLSAQRAPASSSGSAFSRVRFQTVHGVPGGEEAPRRWRSPSRRDRRSRAQPFTLLSRRRARRGRGGRASPARARCGIACRDRARIARCSTTALSGLCGT